MQDTALQACTLSHRSPMIDRLPLSLLLAHPLVSGLATLILLYHMPLYSKAEKLARLDFRPCIGYNPLCQQNTSGFGVVATCNFPKVDITGSSPVTRSRSDLYLDERRSLYFCRLLLALLRRSCHK